MSYHTSNTIKGIAIVFLLTFSFSCIKAQEKLKYIHVNLNVKTTTSSNVISQIEKQTNIFFVYNTDYLNNNIFITNFNKAVKVSKKINFRLDSLLSLLFQGTGLKYDEINGQIVVSKQIKKNESAQSEPHFNKAAPKGTVDERKSAKPVHQSLKIDATGKKISNTIPVKKEASSGKADTVAEKHILKNDIPVLQQVERLEPKNDVIDTSFFNQPLILDTISKKVEPQREDSIGKAKVAVKSNHTDSIQKKPGKKTPIFVSIEGYVTVMRFVKSYSPEIFKSEVPTNLLNPLQDNSLSLLGGINLGADYKNWFIRSGLAFAQINSKFGWTEMRDSIKIIPSDSIHAAIFDTIQVSSEHSLKNSYQYVEIPFSAGYTIKVSKNCSFSLSGGVVSCFLVKVKGMTHSLENAEIGLAKKDFNSVYFVLKSAIGINYNISKKTLFFTTIDYRTNLTQMYKYSSNINNRQSWWGITMGIRNRF